jgi:dipeptidyl aminopeptidase/acylaminoacyl peptidase
VVRRDLATGKETVFDLRADDTPTGDRSPDFLAWSRDGRWLYLTADHLGQHALFALDVRTGHGSLFMKTGSVTFPRPLPDGRVLFGWSSLQRPVELYVAGLGGEENRRLTKLNDDRMETVRMGKIGAFAFKGAGGQTVSGRLIYPVDFDGGRKYPVAFLIHGGPQTSHLNEFNYRWNPQVLAGSGYAVVAIDYPGSTGYGQAYVDTITGDWGGTPFKDLLAGLQVVLERYPFLDRERIGALGPSYGGYLINWMAGHEHPFRCFVSHAGIFDRERFYYETDETWFAEWESGGTPWINPGGHKRHNPADRVENWRTPTLVIHGERDFRVPYTQGLSAFTALQRKGIPSKLLIFPDEGHWVLKPQNTLQWHQTVLSWLDQWLLP